MTAGSPAVTGRRLSVWAYMQGGGRSSDGSLQTFSSSCNSFLNETGCQVTNKKASSWEVKKKVRRILQDCPGRNGLRCVACMLASSDSVTCYLIKPHASPRKQALLFASFTHEEIKAQSGGETCP